MKLPRAIRTYCPSCRQHSEHEVERVKRGKASELKQGQRRFRRVTAGYGGFPRGKPSSTKMTKREHLRFRCKQCGKAHQKSTKRAGRLKIE